jgi:hypothetical protein
MKLEELNALDQKRTQGDWRKGVSREVYAVNDGRKSQVLQQSWHNNQDLNHRHEDIDYICAMPKAMLLLKRYAEALEDIASGLHSADYCNEIARKTLWPKED